MFENEHPEPLSSEKIEKIKILEELLPNFFDTKTTKNGDLFYNEIFDKFYEKDLGELIILNKLYRT